VKYGLDRPENKLPTYRISWHLRGEQPFHFQYAKPPSNECL